ncbi:ArfGap-domain-containing protein [Schizophyllum commune H4-8]|uniref:Arf-GAP domain-containing protein n=1 Tax=Schizophyllum commune (strain H4-8 / FGSC 9210) TaxID=578458 RepID=D8PJU2_SCHCM|nr:ArfGap-domain-containing protein [Schizophyllum commune H4-8]KAI5893992.1 ArfGap-domain-containing protein [Schizophyllum commune H4-8]
MATDQAAAKKTLQALAKREDLGNKACVDCGNPNPQWASISFAVLLCLQCAGTHRGFGVHISFVRSITMDTWTEDQLKRMGAGGNKPFKDFMAAYGPQGGYAPGASPHETYHCWAATEYKAKLDADLAGKPFTPSAPPAGANTPTSAGLRKSRASSGRTGSPAFGRTVSPAPGSTSPNAPGTPTPGGSGNESYFARLGAANASRSADLPPSQGGRYTGFGSTPSPESNPSHPAFGLSSRAAPSLQDLQQDPVGALGKGWSLFSAAVSAAAGTGLAVAGQGLAAVQDPAFQGRVKGYVNSAGEYVTTAGSAANDWSRTQFGVDVGGAVRERLGGAGGGGYGSGYSSLGGGPNRTSGWEHEESSALYRDEDDELFTEYKRAQAAANAAPPAATTSAAAAKPAPKKDEWDDDWKDF